MSADLAAFVLRWAVRTLPDRQAEWGEAMCAELAGLRDGAERRRFALGCSAALLRRPAAVVAGARWSFWWGVVGCAVALAWTIDVPRTRFEALAVVVAFVGGLALLRTRAGFGPLAAGRSARLLAGFGALTVAAEVMLELRRLHVDPPLTLPVGATAGVFDPARAGADLARLTIVLGLLLLGVTRVTASRTAVRPSTLVAALGAVALAVGAWVVGVLIHPGVASSALPGLLAAAVAAILAGVRARRSQGVLALLVAVVGSLAVIGALMDLLPLTGRWVANDAAPVFVAHPPTRVTDTIGLWLPCALASVAVALAARLDVRGARVASRARAAR